MLSQQNMKLYSLFATTPMEAQKPIKGGRLNGFTDINPMWRIKRLTEVFGPVGLGWKYEVVSQRLEPGSGSEVAAFVDIRLYYKLDDKWSDAVPGSGGAKFITKEAKGDYTSDECFKMAITDAIGSACKLLGMSADIFFSKDRTKYTDQDDGSGDVVAEAAAVRFRSGPHLGETLGDVWRSDIQYIRTIRKDPSTPADILAAIEAINNAQKRS